MRPNIEVFEGSLFDVDADVLIHQSNCFNTFGSGVAKEMKRRYPKAYDADCMTKRGDKKKLGQFSLTMAYDKPIIINMYSQYNYGRTGECFTNYDAMTTSMGNIEGWLIKMDMEYKTIAMPYNIGCGLGGGDWEQVSSIIDSVFGGSKFNVRLCKV